MIPSLFPIPRWTIRYILVTHKNMLLFIRDLHAFYQASECEVKMLSFGEHSFFWPAHYHFHQSDHYEEVKTPHSAIKLDP